jgi:gliding motility-associated-like protein
MRNILYLFLCLIFFPLVAQEENPMGFIENKGQIVDQKGKPNPEVKYLLNTNGLNVQLRKNGFSYDVYETIRHPNKPKQDNTLAWAFRKETNTGIENYTAENSYHRVDIDFVNANPAAQIIAEEKSTDHNNYYNIPNNPDGVIEVYQFQKVVYKNIYTGIDVVFFIPEDKSKAVEYNFIVHSGGNTADIRIKFNGAKTELRDNKITMHTRFGKIEETLPLSWTENGTIKIEIPVHYIQITKNVYGFACAENVSDKTLIIDPVPVRLWGTYCGGSGDEMASDITTNDNKDVFITGNSASANNIATSGTYQSSLIGVSNMFFVKYDSAGTRIWGTYFYYDNGIFNSHIARIKTDGNDNLYIASEEQYNTNLATAGAFQTTKNDYTDGILVKLNPSGIRLWATYYGGNGNEYFHSLVIDNSGNIYGVGATSSNDVMATPGAHQTTKLSPGSYDTGFIVKFDPNGNRIWGTFYGGDKADGFFDSFISNDGFLYAIGTRNSANNIATPGTFQPTSNQTGGMIIKFDQNGNRIWGTYIADNSYCFRGMLKGDHIVLFGRTFSDNGLGTPGTMFENYINPLPSGSTIWGNENNYIIKFNVQTQQYVWGSYFFEQIADVDIDASDNVFFSGSTGITSGLATPDAYMPTMLTGYKSYLIKLNPFGQKIWGTYYGGNGGEQLGAVEIDQANDIYLFGNTMGSTTGIATTGASQTTMASNPDTYLVKFRDCLSSTNASSNTPVCLGGTLNLTASGGTNYSWTGPNGFTSNAQNPSIPLANAANAGEYYCNITGTTACDGTNTVTVVVGDIVKPIPNVAVLPAVTGDCNTAITIPAATDNCAGPIAATTTDPLSYSLPGTYIIHWNYDDGNGNIETQNQTVTITSVPLPVLISSQTYCIQQNATLSTLAIAGQNIKWYDAQTGGNALPNTTMLVNGTTYYASQNINTCESLRVAVTTNIQNTPAPTGDNLQTFCAAQNPTINVLAANGNNLIWYDTASGYSVLPNTTALTDGDIYYVSQTVNGCESIARLAVTVNLINTLNATDYAEAVCDESNDNSEIADLTDYNGHLITDVANCTFEYYSSFAGATNQASSELIGSPTNYLLPLGLTSIYVRITSNNGCYQIVRLDLTLVGKPIISIPDTVPMCERNNVTINAGAGFDSYLWSTGATSQTIIISQADNYSVIVTKNHGTVPCSTTKTFTVALSNAATITSIDTQDWTDSDNVITVNVSGYGDYEYSLDGVNYQADNVFSGLNGGAYMVYIRDKNGCGIVKDDVFLLTYPKFFTPNGDGYNDNWAVHFSFYEPGLKVSIFDRYGKLVSQLNHLEPWNGEFSGNELPSDDYWFVVTRASGKEYRGHFSLKR